MQTPIFLLFFGK